jgi:hypothetical protein
MVKTKLAIVSVPDKNKHFVVQSTEEERWIMVGAISISGSIVGIGSTYEEAVKVLDNLKD